MIEKKPRFYVAVRDGRYLRCICGKVLGYRLGTWAELVCPKCHVEVRFDRVDIDIPVAITHT